MALSNEKERTCKRWSTVKQPRPQNLAFVRELIEAGRLAPAVGALDQFPPALDALGSYISE